MPGGPAQRTPLGPGDALNLPEAPHVKTLPQAWLELGRRHFLEHRDADGGRAMRASSLRTERQRGSSGL
eukprot:11173278-Lingulodinium_polyedra.AAC.1